MDYSDFPGAHAWPPSHSAETGYPGYISGGREFVRAFFRRGAAGELLSETRLGAQDGTGRTPKMARLEAVLLVADAALSTRRLAQLAMLADATEARTLVEQLNACYDAVECAFRIERVATGYQMLTRPEFAFWLDRIHNRQTELKLSPPAMETLAIVAYRQPLTRADIEAVRGVQCAEMLKQLMERGLVKIGGEEDSLGRPYLYETTRKFLELFGLRTLDDLPMAERLRNPPQRSSRDETAPQDESQAAANEASESAERTDGFDESPERDAEGEEDFASAA